MKSIRCPICDLPLKGDGPAVVPTFPFCGKRCRTIDLGRWLGEEYGVPHVGRDDAPPEDDAPETP